MFFYDVIPFSVMFFVSQFVQIDSPGQPCSIPERYLFLGGLFLLFVYGVLPDVCSFLITDSAFATAKCLFSFLVYYLYYMAGLDLFFDMVSCDFC